MDQDRQKKETQEEVSQSGSEDLNLQWPKKHIEEAEKEDRLVQEINSIGAVMKDAADKEAERVLEETDPDLYPSHQPEKPSISDIEKAADEGKHIDIGPSGKVNISDKPPTLEVPEMSGGEGKRVQPETAAEILQLMQDKIKQKIYNEKQLEILTGNPQFAVEEECRLPGIAFEEMAADVQEIIVAAYFSQLILNVEGKDEFQNKTLAKKVINNILENVNRVFDRDDFTFTPVEAAHLIHELRGVE